MMQFSICVGMIIALVLKTLVLCIIWATFFVPMGLPEVRPVLMLVAMSFYELFTGSGETSGNQTDDERIEIIKRSLSSTCSIAVLCTLFYFLEQV